MKLSQSFEVDAPADEVFAALVDVERVAPCLPGAEITESGDDGTYHGTFSVKLGPASASYRGDVRMEAVDEAQRTATMRANGRDTRGQGSAKALITSRVTEAAGRTRVEVETDLTITGRLARFGRGGMIEDVSNRLLRDFASCLQTRLAAPAPGAGAEPGEAGAGAGAGAEAAPPPKAKPVGGLRLLFLALWDRLRRLFRRS